MDYDYSYQEYGQTPKAKRSKDLIRMIRSASYSGLAKLFDTLVYWAQIAYLKPKLAGTIDDVVYTIRGKINLDNGYPVPDRSETAYMLDVCAKYQQIKDIKISIEDIIDFIEKRNKAIIKKRKLNKLEITERGSVKRRMLFVPRPRELTRTKYCKQLLYERKYTYAQIQEMISKKFPSAEVYRRKLIGNQRHDMNAGRFQKSFPVSPFDPIEYIKPPKEKKTLRKRIIADCIPTTAKRDGVS